MDVVIRTYKPRVGKSDKYIYRNVTVVSYTGDDLKICSEDEDIISIQMTENVQVTFYGKYMNN